MRAFGFTFQVALELARLFNRPHQEPLGARRESRFSGCPAVLLSSRRLWWHWVSADRRGVRDRAQPWSDPFKTGSIKGTKEVRPLCTTHSNETTHMRLERSLASVRLAMLESVGFAIGLLKGTRTRGRKPDRMGEAYPELQALYQKLVIECAKHSA